MRRGSHVVRSPAIRSVVSVAARSGIWRIAIEGAEAFQQMRAAAHAESG